MYYSFQCTEMWQTDVAQSHYRASSLARSISCLKEITVATNRHNILTATALVTRDRLSRAEAKKRIALCLSHRTGKLISMSQCCNTEHGTWL